jgi:drug/metabolite transporter (DMT)-like permease
MAFKTPQIPPLLGLSVGVLAVSVSSILIRFAQGEAPSLTIAAGRTSFASLVLLPLCLRWRREELRQMRRGDWGLGLLSGAFLGLHFASWISSLAYTSVASSTVLVTTSPLWVGLASPFLLKERVPRPLRVGIVLAMTGSLIIALLDAPSAAADGARPWFGNGLALLGALTAAAYLIIGRRLRSHLSLLTYTTVVYGTAAIFLLAVMAAAGQTLLGFSPRIYVLLLLMALGPQLLGHSSFNWALGFLPASYVAVTIISEPIGAGLLAFAILGEVPGAGTLVGGALILAGIVVASRRPGKSQKTEA